MRIGAPTRRTQSIGVKLLIGFAGLCAAYGLSEVRVGAAEPADDQNVELHAQLTYLESGDDFVTSHILATLTDPLLVGAIEPNIPNPEALPWRPESVTSFDRDWFYVRTRNLRVAKWVGPIRIYIGDQASYGKEVSDLAKEISAETGLDIRLVPSYARSSANLVIHILKPRSAIGDEEFCIAWPCNSLPDPLKRATGTVFRAAHDRADGIYQEVWESESGILGRNRDNTELNGEFTSTARGEIVHSECRIHFPRFVQDSTAAWIEVMIAKCMLHALGIPNEFDTAELNWTILSGLYYRFEPQPVASIGIGWLDRLALQILYDRRITPGMSAKAAYPVIRSVVQDWRHGLEEERDIARAGSAAQ